MFYKIKYIVILLAGCMVAFFGCGRNGSISLEDALTVMHAEEEISVNTTSGDDLSTETEQTLCVYVCGAVLDPGVYELNQGSRIVAAVDAAGGFLPDAATEAVNLAEYLQDGMQIVVPTKAEAEKAKSEILKREDGRVNLNTASVAELCTLSGIGEAKAEAILAYRTEIGAFSSIEQLKEVTGIGERLFNQIKNSIYIE